MSAAEPAKKKTNMGADNIVTIRKALHEKI